MLKIYLTRHGQDIDNSRGILNGRRDSGLTPTGVKQAKKLANDIKKRGIKFDAIYTSPLKRTLETSRIISKYSDNPAPVIMDELIERNFGILTGKKLKLIEELGGDKILKTDDCTYFLDVEGCETFPQLLKRALKVIKEIKLKHKRGSVLLVTHGDLGKMVCSVITKRDWKDILSLFRFGNTELILAQNKKIKKVISSKQFNL